MCKIFNCHTTFVSYEIFLKSFKNRLPGHLKVETVGEDIKLVSDSYLLKQTKTKFYDRTREVLTVRKNKIKIFLKGQKHCLSLIFKENNFRLSLFVSRYTFSYLCSTRII